MRIWWNGKPISTLGAAPQVRPATRGERGQALIVVAMAMIGLLAFVGLTVDSGILFISEGHLRRAVDAAALAAAAQFRVGRSHDQLAQSAVEVLRLNGVNITGINDPNYHMYLCDPTDTKYDDTLNDPGSTMCSGTLHRKLIKIVATVPVRFAFLGIIGIPSTNVVANSVSETASVDVVLVIDTSNSMTFDASRGLITDTTNMWYPDNCNPATPSDPADAAAGYTGNCHPFLEVKKAAVNFISHLYYPYDRLSIVTFDNLANEVLPITNTETVAQWETAVKTLNVSEPRDPDLNPAVCNYQPYTTTTPYQPNPSNCTNTSTGGGLRLAGGEFGKSPIRQESVWVVILLTDGAANASVQGGLASNRWCPVSTYWDQTNDPNLYSPFCRDADPTTRHTLIDPATYAIMDPGGTAPYLSDPTHYDSDDYARDQADFVACASKLAQSAKWCRDSQDYTANLGGQGALIFAIGLGKLVIDNSQGGCALDVNNKCVSPETRILPSDGRAGYAAGDTLLRYISRVGGGSGDPDPHIGQPGQDPCYGVSAPHLTAQPDPKAPVLDSGNLSYNCGNYYFSQFGTGLNAVFQSIASRIFTRITQ